MTRIAKSGKKVAVIGIENGYPLGTDLKRVKEFYDRGGRYMSLAHNGHNQLADSHTGEAGTSGSGAACRRSAASPAGDEPPGDDGGRVASVESLHPSGDRHVEGARHRVAFIGPEARQSDPQPGRRDADGDKTNGGVVQINAVADFIKADPRERAPAIASLRQEFGLSGGRGGGAGRGAAPFNCPVEGAQGSAGSRGGRGSQAPGPESLAADRRAEFDRRMAQIDRQWPAAGRATIKDYVDHIDYAAKLIGIDHVGIASDFDGGGGVDGWNSAAESFNVTLELVRRGYTEEQIAKIWSGNLLRVWSEVEKVAAGIQAGRR